MFAIATEILVKLPRLTQRNDHQQSESEWSYEAVPYGHLCVPERVCCFLG